MPKPEPQPASLEPPKVAPPPAPPSTDRCENLFQLVCSNRQILEDPTGVVQPDIRGEVEALRIYETIIHQHPTWTSQQVDEELVKQIYTDRRRSRLIDVHAWVLDRMKRFIDRQPSYLFPAGTKRLFKQRLESTILELPPPATKYASEPDLFTKNDVYFGSFPSGKTAIRIGGAYVLTAKSRFNRVFTFAHELAHAIDPCELSHILRRMPSPYRHLVACFRETQTIKTPLSKPSCARDNPLIEVFADWVATEITADALFEHMPQYKDDTQKLNSVINSVKDLCHQESWLEEEIKSHPSPETRIRKIFGQHPRIREFLGCPPMPAYCNFGGAR